MPTRKTRTNNTYSTISDVLRSDGALSKLLPAAENIMALQKKCLETFPDHFSACQILSLEKEKLLIAAPNQSSAARLRQKLPFLQEVLIKSGWQIDHIRIKVRLPNSEKRLSAREKKPLPPKAVEAMVLLRNQLEKNKQNEALISALDTLVNRHKKS